MRVRIMLSLALASPIVLGAGRANAIVSDALPVYTVPSVLRPSYLVSSLDPTLQSTVERIANDAGASTSPVAGTWGMDARHVYSKQEGWNSDQTLLSIENRSGGNPSPLLLDGNTYRPRFTPCASYDLYDYRWHPSKLHPHEQINVTSTGRELMWFDVTTCTKTRTWSLPLTAGYGIGSGEGNPSNDGRFIALGNDTQIVVVDMDPQPPYAPYPNVRMGPVYTLPPESLLAGEPQANAWVLDNLSISASGKYVDVKFDSGNDSTWDAHRIFEVDPATLALAPHNMATSSLRCGSFQARPNGWIFPLKHADMALDPDDNDEDVMVGGNVCPGSGLGQILKVRLRDGRVTSLTGGANEADMIHVSTRNLQRPGWAYVDYYKEPGRRFSDEIVAVKLDGSGKVERLCHTHTAFDSCYRCEAHPSPSPDGRRVLFASNWAQDCLLCGSAADIKDYVVMDLGAFTVDVPTPRPKVPHVALAVGTPLPNPATARFAIDVSLPSDGPATLEFLNVAGRVLQRVDLGAPGTGSHRVPVERAAGLKPGVYWLRLVQDGVRAEAKMLVLL